jgi:hypothetical protein
MQQCSFRRTDICNELCCSTSLDLSSLMLMYASLFVLYWVFSCCVVLLLAVLVIFCLRTSVARTVHMMGQANDREVHMASRHIQRYPYYQGSYFNDSMSCSFSSSVSNFFQLNSIISPSSANVKHFIFIICRNPCLL